MKSNILKFTTAVMAVSLVAVSPQVHAMNHEQEQFVGSMVQEIGQTMFSLLDLLKNFVTKSNTQKLAAYTKALSEQVIKASALNTKLKAEMDAIAASAPGSEYHKILQAMYAYSSLAHTQLMNFFTSLDTFSRSA